MLRRQRASEVGQLGEMQRAEEERQEQENEACTAGTRNPEHIMDSWPGFVQSLAAFRDRLLRHLEVYPSMCQVDRMLGPEPDASPPTQASVAPLLSDLASLWGKSYNEVRETPTLKLLTDNMIAPHA